MDTHDDQLLEEAEVLIWSLLDDAIETTDIQRLEKLLAENEHVRQQYLSCVQMHTDLIEHFGADQQNEKSESLSKSPVLGSLGDVFPAIKGMPPVVD